MRQCKVYVHDVEAGILQETDTIREEPYRSQHLFPYFFNMLSEGSNRQMQSMLLHIDEKDDFGIMLATAQYDTIGAVTVKPI